MHEEQAEASHNGVVLLIDSKRDRREEVAAIVARYARCITSEEFALRANHAVMQDAAGALLAADPESIDAPPFADAIRVLRDAGLLVACYCDGAARWPLPLRAQVLAWGAHPLLDRSIAEFESEVARLIWRLESRSLRACSENLSRISDLGIVARSKPMLTVLRRVERLSHLSDLPVLILGQTGTGKEMVARALHQLDAKRCRGPLIAVNCGALPRHLAEAELFGHARGAFSGAERSRRGFVRAAHGGVLFLDEIGELELGLQAKLLRVLQEGRVLPVGEDQDTGVDVRIVAATHQDLSSMVKAGTFREDLLHRLWVVPVRIPSMRERAADVAPLVDTFLRKHRSLRPSGPAAVTTDFVEALAQVDLPGNVRQLENIVRRALAESDHKEPLGLSDLPDEVLRELAGKRTPATSDLRSALATQKTDYPDADLNLARAVESCEQVVLKTALVRAKGSQTQAARLLGISYRCIYNKIRKYGMTGVAAPQVLAQR